MERSAALAEHTRQEIIRLCRAGLDTRALLDGLIRRLRKVVPIDVIQENVVALIATAHEVVHRSGILDSKLARHERLIGARDLIVNLKCGAFLRSDPTDHRGFQSLGSASFQFFVTRSLSRALRPYFTA